MKDGCQDFRITPKNRCGGKKNNFRSTLEEFTPSKRDFRSQIDCCKDILNECRGFLDECRYSLNECGVILNDCNMILSDCRDILNERNSILDE